MRNRPLSVRLLGGLTLLALCAACSREPERGMIRKLTEKDDAGNLFREIEYYLDTHGRQVAHGETIYYYPDGTVKFRGINKDNQKDGEWIEYYESGNKKGSVSFKNNLADGPFRAWYEDGRPKVEGQNIRGMQTGKWAYYHEDGTQDRIELWDKGKRKE